MLHNSYQQCLLGKREFLSSNTYLNRIERAGRKLIYAHESVKVVQLEEKKDNLSIFGANR